MVSYDSNTISGFESHSGRLEYVSIDPNSILMRPISNAIMHIQINGGSTEDFNLLQENNIVTFPWELDKDTCKSKPIICYIQDTELGYTIAANNGTNNEIPYCIRHVLKNDPDNNYIDCRSFCCQPAHAEIMAVVDFLLYKGIIEFDKLESIFPESLKVNGTVKFGNVTHTTLLKYIRDNCINIGDSTNVFLYGHEICCDKCAEVLLALGVTQINLAPETHQDEYIRRDEIHAGIRPDEIQVLQSETHNQAES